MSGFVSCLWCGILMDFGAISADFGWAIGSIPPHWFRLVFLGLTLFGVESSDLNNSEKGYFRAVFILKLITRLVVD